MPPARRSPFPLPPDLPQKFDPSPTALRTGDDWDQVAGDEDVAVDDIVIDAQLRSVTWTRGRLVGRRLPGLICQDVRFVQCDLAGAVLEDAHFTRVVFESCRMSGAVLAGARLQDVALIDCIADRADYRMAQLRRTAAESTNLAHADFYGAELIDVRLSTCDLSGANFDAARPQRLDLRGSTLDGVRGGTSLAAAHIGADQVVPLGIALVGALGFQID